MVCSQTSSSQTSLKGSDELGQEGNRGKRGKQSANFVSNIYRGSYLSGHVLLN